MITSKGQKLYLVLSTPRRYRGVEDRSKVWIALGTNDMEEARRRAEMAAVEQRARWAIRAGEVQLERPVDRFRRLSDLAGAQGFAYKPAKELAVGPIEDVLARTEALEAQDVWRHETADALLGAAPRPTVMLSGLLAHVEGLDEVKTANRFKSPEQMRLWRNPRLRAIANLRTALTEVGRPDDILAEEINHDIARIHQRYWKRRIERDKVSPDTAEKDYANMSGMLRAFYDANGKRYENPYSGVSHKDRFRQQKRKAEFGLDWITEYIAAPGAMAGLNDQARAIVQIIAETGCRQSEIYNAPPGSIVLDGPIPYISIKPEEGVREIKNKASIRKMPLVGIALEAARRFPNGFPQYAGKSSFSATVNKHFQGVFPSEDHTIGGLRHSWESRLSGLGLLNEYRGAMMGHSIEAARGRPVYGDDLALRARWIIARLAGIGVITDEADREATAEELRKLMDQLRKSEMKL